MEELEKKTHMGMTRFHQEDKSIFHKNLSIVPDQGIRWSGIFLCKRLVT